MERSRGTDDGAVFRGAGQISQVSEDHTQLLTSWWTVAGRRLFGDWDPAFGRDPRNIVLVHTNRQQRASFVERGQQRVFAEPLRQLIRGKNDVSCHLTGGPRPAAASEHWRLRSAAGSEPKIQAARDGISSVLSSFFQRRVNCPPNPGLVFRSCPRPSRKCPWPSAFLSSVWVSVVQSSRFAYLRS